MKITIRSIVVFVVALCTSQNLHAQATFLYVSNLLQTPTRSAPVASDSWLAQPFGTGTNAGGYALNSVQLLMDGAEGNPSGFNVSIHTSSTGLLNGQPNNRLGNLVGSDPSAGGIFTYTASDLTLSPSTVYYLVLSATTTATQGAYNWSATDASITGGKEGWFIGNFYFGSTDGSNWQPSRQEIPQLGIFATPIPEPGVLGLLGLGGIAALWCRRKNSPQKNRH